MSVKVADVRILSSHPACPYVCLTVAPASRHSPPQIKFGDNVTLLVSQEPDEWIDPDREKAALRHTAL